MDYIRASKFTHSQPDLLHPGLFQEYYDDEPARSDPYLVHSPEPLSPKAPPTSRISRTASLARRNANARNLIHRYNSLDSLAIPVASPTRRTGLGLSVGEGMGHLPTSASMSLAPPLSATDTKRLPMLKTSYSETQFADHNPIRNTVKNLFGALGWPKREPTFKAIRYRPRDVIPETDSERSVTMHTAVEGMVGEQSVSALTARDAPLLSPVPINATKAHKSPLLMPYDEAPRKTGLLQYLQADHSWLPSLVTLTSNKLRIDPQMSDQFTPMDLPLFHCIDVRSLSSKETRELLSVAPLIEGETTYVLEVEFQQSNLKRFATQSISERGAWVSSLWYVCVA